jgi:hypothetical protein
MAAVRGNRRCDCIITGRAAATAAVKSGASRRVSERTLDGGPAGRLSDALLKSDNGRPILTVRSSIKLYTLTPPRLPLQGFGAVV